MAAPQFDFFPRDFLAATIGWPAATRGHYITLLCVQWEQGSLPADPKRLEAISPGVAAEWAELEGKFPVGEDGKRRNPRLEKERAYRDSRSAAGKAAAAARWSGASDSHSQSHMRSHMRTAMQNDCQGASSPQSPSAAADSKDGCAKDGNAPIAGETQDGCDSHSQSHMRSHMRNGCPPSPSPSPTQEEIQNTSCFVATTETPKRRRSRPADSIRWSPAAGWEGIEDADRKAWAAAYPAVDVAGELARMGEWLKANPAKARKSLWRAFVTKWLTRSQDRGGSVPSNRPQGGGNPARLTVDEIQERDRKRAWWRSDAMENMTAAQYEAWKRSRVTDSTVAGLAASLRARSPENGKSPAERETPF